MSGRRSADRLLGTLPQGSVIHAAPRGLQASGVLYIATHPDHPPQLVTPWGVRELRFIPDPHPIYPTVPTHSIQANPPGLLPDSGAAG